MVPPMKLLVIVKACRDTCFSPNEDKGNTQIVGYCDGDWDVSPIDRNQPQGTMSLLVVVTVEEEREEKDL